MLVLEPHEAVRLHDPPPHTRPPKSYFLQLMATLAALTWTCMFPIQRKHLRPTAPACISPWCLIIWRPLTPRPWRRIGWRSLAEKEISFTMAIGKDEFIIIVTGMRFSFEHFGFYSPSRLVLHWMEELIMELLLVENVWCQKQSWFFMHLLCSGMVGFSLRRSFRTAGKEHPSPLFPLQPQHQ